MKITRDTEYRQHLLDSQRSRMGVGERREGTHVSDLIMCARKAWAERVTQHVPTIADETILTWLRGLSHEALLTDGVEQVRSGYCFDCQYNWPWTPEIAKEQVCPTCGEILLTGTIDWVTLEDNEGTDPGVVIDNYTPVEMKSTLKSSRKSIEDGDMLWFVDQVKSYMFMHKRKTGRIAVLHVMGDYSRSDPNIRSNGPKADLRVYKVEWEDEQEMKDWGTELHVSKAVVEEPLAMPPLDLRSPRHNMICEYCVIGEMLPTGNPCENYPWTPEGMRRGTASAKKFTMDEIEAELGAFTNQTQQTDTATQQTIQQQQDMVNMLKDELAKLRGSSDPVPAPFLISPKRAIKLVDQGYIDERTGRSAIRTLSQCPCGFSDRSCPHVPAGEVRCDGSVRCRGDV